MSTHPEVLWAQRSSSSAPEKNVIYLTVNLPNIVESSLKYTPSTTSLSFEASTGGDARPTHAFNLDLFAEIVPEKSISKLTSRSFNLVLQKKESQSGYWPRLTKEKVKTPFIKTDFGKWVDEDEQDGNDNVDDDFGAGGMGGMGGMDDGMDFSKMMAQMGGSSGAGAGTSTGAEAIESDSDSNEDDGPPPLEDGELPK